ncbi:Alkaline phosphatase synthesis transcriptional regulatory protein SphR [compost metagenome]
MTHSKQICSRSMILHHLWDMSGEFIDDNTLSVHIRRLREKIEDDPANPRYITTVRGVGYKWNMEVAGALL